MKRIITVALGLLAFSGVQAQRNCAVNSHQHAIESAYPETKANRAAIENHTNAFIANGAKSDRAVVTIPVVVHVLYNTAAQNISDAQIASQLAVLNADFSKTNTDASLVPAAFTALTGNPDIQFCLAQRDPNGAATTGIQRKSTTKTSFDASLDDAKNATAGLAAWPASSYLNLWVVPDIKDGAVTGILGYAQFPGGPAATDGVVIGYQYFGTTGTAVAPFNKGRTGTHEVGHWLNLRHIWGDDDNGNGSCTSSTECSGSDLVGDTPNQCERRYGCPAFPSTDGCTPASPGVMFMNYMDYTDDACMYMFSVGQVSRMQALFATGGSRASLKTSLGCTPPTTGGTCGAPASLAAGSIAQTSATLSWAAVSGATSYNVSYKTAAATTFSTPVTVTGTTYALSGLVAGTTYNWQVNATCASGSSTLSSSSFATTAVSTGCTDIYEANETRTAGKTIAVNTNISARIATATDRDWFKFSNTTANRNIKIDLTTLPADYDVKLYRGSTLVGTSELGGTSNEQIKFNNGTVTTYYVNVYGYGGVFNANSCYTLRASLSATAWRGTSNNTVDVEENINLEKIAGDFDVTIAPNPSNGNMHIEVLNLTAVENATVNIYDITGRLVYSTNIAVAAKSAGSTDLQLDLPNGMYQAVVGNEQVSITKKIVIQK
jgi:hypothetical protein